MTDNVNHPKHYNSGKFEVIEVLEDWNLSFHLANAVKYVARAGKKNPDKYVEDLENAIWYLRRAIELESKTPRRPNEMPQKRVLEGLGGEGKLMVEGYIEK